MSAAPKTVTFNAEPHTEAAYRSARLGSRVIGATLCVAVVALIFNIDVAPISPRLGRRRSSSA